MSAASLARLLRERLEQVADSVGQPPENRVRERDRPREPCRPHELDRLVHGGVARDAVDEAELVRAQPQRRSDRRVEPVHLSPSERLDRVIERPHPLHGAVGEALRERAVPLVQPGRGGAERVIGVRVVFEDAQEDLVRRPPRRAYLSPRSHASYSILRPPSGCTSSGSNEPSSATRARQTVTSRSWSSRPRSDVRGERADLVHQLRRRSREIEDAIGGRDLVGIRDALVGLRSIRRLRVLEHVGRGARPRSAQPWRRARRRRPPARSRSARCAAIGPASSSFTSSMIVTPVSSSPAISARSTGAAPRQRGRSDGCTFSQRRSCEQRLGNEAAVRDCDHRRRAEVQAGLERVGLQHRDPERLCGCLGRRRASFRPRPAAHPVG